LTAKEGSNFPRTADGKMEQGWWPDLIDVMLLEWMGVPS
jgi:hypothetical protein